jgi:two-component system NtrC family sensor kinase
MKALNERQKVLVVDDSKSVREYVTELLNTARFEAISAPDGETALRYIDTYKPDVVLLDIIMPRIDGLEVLRSLRKKELISTLLFTTQSDTSDIILGLNLGADDYIVKPFKDEELIARVKVAARRVVVLRELAEARKEAERNFRRLCETQAELINQGRLAGFSRLAAGAAHEMNNALNTVKSNIDTLKSYSPVLLETSLRLEQLASTIISEGPRSVESAREAISWIAGKELKDIQENYNHLINETTQGIDRLTYLLKTLSSMDTVNSDVKDFTNMNQIADEVIQLVSNMVPQSVEICFNKGTIPEVRCNRSQLKIAVLNIVDNAIDAIKGGGKVNLSTYSEKGRSCLEVRDTGCGIRPSDLEHVYDPFFTTKGIGKGIGLGLTISNNIAHSYGGDVHIKSSDPTGTAVVIQIPADGTV